MMDVEIVTGAAEGGAEVTIAGMEENSRMEIGRKTYRFVRRLMRDPEMKKRIRERAAEIRAEEALA